MALNKHAYEETVEKIMHSYRDGEDTIQYLALSAVDRGHVFETLFALASQLGGTSNSHFSPVIGAKMRVALLDLIRSSSDVGYTREVVEATVSALTGGQTYWDLLDSQQLRREDDPVAQFLNDEELVESITGTSYPEYIHGSRYLS